MVRVLSFVLDSRRALRSGADSLDFELDVDAVTDEDAARLEHLIPGQAEVLAIEGSPRGEADAQVPPRILSPAAVLRVERDLARHAADRQIADDAVAPLAHLLDALARELKLGKLLHVEEV